MAQTLDALLTVTSLASGAEVTMLHGLQSTSGAGLTPTFINPLGLTPIGVLTADASSVTFHNYGSSTESAIFLVRRDFSTQVPTTATVAAWWRGYAGLASFLLSEPQWEDLRVAVTATESIGADPPLWAKFADNGEVGAGYALAFDGAASSAVAGADFGDFSASFAVCFWMVPALASAPLKRVLFKSGSWDITLTGGFVRVGLQGLTNVTSTTPFLVGARNFIAVNVIDDGAGTVTVEIWQNNVLTDSVAQAGALAADNANLLYVGSNNVGVQFFDGTLDELRLYQDTLSSTDIAELWSGGAGTTDEPISAPTKLAGYHFDEGSGTTADNYEGTADYDLTLTATTWVTGLTASAATLGVFYRAFRHGEDQSLIFAAQMTHAYQEGTDLDVHVHWSPSSAEAGNVVWGVEYTISNINEADGNTTVVEAAAAAGGVAKKHLLHDIATIDGTGLKISHMITGRVYRKGTAAGDTYPDPAFFRELDFHHKSDSIGSRQELAK